MTPAIDVDGGAAFDAVTDLGKGTGDIASPAFLPQASGYAVDSGVSIGVRLAVIFWAAFWGRLPSVRHQRQQPHEPIRCGWAVPPTAMSRDGAGWSSFSTGLVLSTETQSEQEAKPAAKKSARRRQAEPDLDDQDSNQSGKKDGEQDEGVRRRVGCAEPHRGTIGTTDA